MEAPSDLFTVWDVAGLDEERGGLVGSCECRGGNADLDCTWLVVAIAEGAASLRREGREREEGCLATTEGFVSNHCSIQPNSSSMSCPGRYIPRLSDCCTSRCENILPSLCVVVSRSLSMIRASEGSR